MNFETPFQSTDAQALSAFEAVRGVTLPETYKAFLLKTNGGIIPDPSALVVPPMINTLLDRMFGLVPIEAQSIAREELGNFAPDIARQFIRIADDIGGEVIVMDLRPGMQGQIYMRAHDLPPNDPPAIDVTGLAGFDLEEATLYHPIAADFDAFVAMLTPETAPG
jgi:hypothetical protein